MPTSVRLDPETESLLERLARSRGQSKSAILREALHRLAQSPSEVAGDSLFAQVSDLIGVAENGPEDLGRQHKQAFRALLAEKRRQ